MKLQDLKEYEITPGSKDWDSAYKQGFKDAQAGKPRKEIGEMWSHAHIPYVQGYGQGEEANAGREHTKPDK